jgi:hypothetical protein
VGRRRIRVRPGAPRRRPLPTEWELGDVLVLQGWYYVSTGVLPFLSRPAFEAITGPKQEWWLVETVGALVTVIGGGLLWAGRRESTSPEMIAVGAGSALALAGIDVVYVAKRRIAPTYLLDAAAELFLVGSMAAARGPGR